MNDLVNQEARQTGLRMYEAARHALSEALRIDEAKEINNRVAAFEAYAKQAKDSELINLATDIKMRAERRVGELLREMPKNKGTAGAAQGRDVSGGIKLEPPEDTTPKLADLGITKKESSNWQKLAALPEDQFEEAVTGAKSAMTKKTEGNAKKPKGAAKDARDKSKTPEAKAAAIAVLDGHKSLEQAAAEFGFGSDLSVRRALAREEGRREKQADPDIDRADLSMTAQQKLDTAIRQHKAKLDAEFHKEVNARVQKFLMETILPQHKAEQKEAKRVMETRKGVMDKATFNAVRRALHPDSRKSISDEMLGRAFDTFMALEKRLLNEENSPTEFQGLPETWADWEAMRKKKKAPTKARRATGQYPVGMKI